MSYIDDVATSDLWSAVAAGTHHHPHDVLGAHPRTDDAGITRTTVRALRPLAESVALVFTDGSRMPMTHAADGIWQAEHDGPPVSYRIAAV
ncbi:MAG: 1,4-alpha-glucan branching enzyme, partial [Corynebacterium marinum]|nr:1,4-alpha-glucan branching enzyme [Corynebacterium marinum]